MLFFLVGLLTFSEIVENLLKFGSDIVYAEALVSVFVFYVLDLIESLSIVGFSGMTDCMNDLHIVGCLVGDGISALILGTSSSVSTTDFEREARYWFFSFLSALVTLYFYLRQGVKRCLLDSEFFFYLSSLLKVA